MKPAIHNPIPMETRVLVPLDGKAPSKNTRLGTVVGVAHKHIFFTYIILLDEPLSTEEGEVRAVAIHGPLLMTPDGKNWLIK